MSRRTWRRPVASLALAAGVAGIVIGFSAGQMAPAILQDSAAVQVAAIQAQLPSVLESEVSGTTVQFSDALQGLSGSVTPVRTFRNGDGSFCRAYEAQVHAEDDRMVSLGIACRDADGQWRTRLQVNDT